MSRIGLGELANPNPETFFTCSSKFENNTDNLFGCHYSRKHCKNVKNVYFPPRSHSPIYRLELAGIENNEL